MRRQSLVEEGLSTVGRCVRANLLGMPKFAVTGAADLRNPNETQGFQFANGGRNCVPMNAVILKILECHRQPTVLLAAVTTVLDLNTGEYTVCRKTEGPVRGRLQRFDR
jgi:hypothetical protein